MLLYRARVEGPVAAVLRAGAGPVRLRPGLGGRAGVARVTLRYALSPSGQVCTHRGWLHTHLPAGTRLTLAAYQADGDALLLSLRPVRHGRGGPQRLLDRFCLPFRLGEGGGSDGALRALSARVRTGCRPLPGALLVHGRLVLEVDGPMGARRLVLPFCRVLPAPVDPGLDWRAYSAVAELNCRVEPGGGVAGEAVLAVGCLGRPPAGPQAQPLPAVAAVREVTARVARVVAEPVGEGRAMVTGVLEVEMDWADQTGWSRWTSREIPFATLLEVPGLQGGDRLEPVAAVDRLTRLSDRLFVLVAVGVTALRSVHLCLEGQFYRVEQVMGQAVATVEVAEPLVCHVEPLPLPVVASLAEAALPGGACEWESLRARFRGPVVAGQGWRSLLGLAGGPAGRLRLPLSGPLPDGAQPWLAGLEAVGPDTVRVRVRALAPGVDALPVEPATTGAEVATCTLVDLPRPLRALSDLILAGGRPWEARLLVHLAGGLRLVAADLAMPPSEPGVTWQPLDGVAVAVSPERVRIDVRWKRITGQREP